MGSTGNTGTDGSLGDRHNWRGEDTGATGAPAQGEIIRPTEDPTTPPRAITKDSIPRYIGVVFEAVVNSWPFLQVSDAHLQVLCYLHFSRLLIRESCLSDSETEICTPTPDLSENSSMLCIFSMTEGFAIESMRGMLHTL